MLLGACGSTEGKDSKSTSKAFQGNLKNIEYDELIEKLDKEESFFLVTLETTDDAFVASGLEKAFDKALENNGIEAYYLGFETMDELPDEERQKDVDRWVSLSDNYSHDDISKDSGASAWSPTRSVFAYADKGKVITAHNYSPMNIEWEDIQRLSEEIDPENEEIIKDIEEVISLRLELWKRWGILD